MVALTVSRVSLVTPIETDSSTIVFYEAEEGAALDCRFLSHRWPTIGAYPLFQIIKYGVIFLTVVVVFVALIALRKLMIFHVDACLS